MRANKSVSEDKIFRKKSKILRDVTWVVHCMFVFSMLSIYAIFSLAFLQLRGQGLNVPHPYSFAFVISIFVIFCGYWLRHGLKDISQRCVQIRHGFWYFVALGVVIRICLFLAWPVEQSNDGLVYWRLALYLISGEEYFIPGRLGGHAFWPPGTPLLYAPFVFFFGHSSWVPLLVNLLLFIITVLATRTICNKILCRRDVGTLSTLLLAIWPNLFLSAGLVSKEAILVALIPLSIAIAYRLTRRASFAGGGIFGFCILTQPALVLAPIFFLVAISFYNRRLVYSKAQLSMIIAGMLLVISPWTLRNSIIFKEFVFVSTNAGFVLHAGNQPSMVTSVEKVGGFVTPPAPPEENMRDDLSRSKWHSTQALTFMLNNPLDFLTLVRNRLLLTFGDDSDSAFRVFRLSESRYTAYFLAAKIVSNLYWLAILLVMAYGMRAKNPSVPEWLVVATLSLFVFIATVHGMYEGGPRHHMAWGWILSIFASCILLPGSRCSPKSR